MKTLKMFYHFVKKSGAMQWKDDRDASRFSSHIHFLSRHLTPLSEVCSRVGGTNVDILHFFRSNVHVRYVSYQHFYSTRHIAFTLGVYELTCSGGDGDGLTDGRDRWQAGDAVEDGISTSVSMKPLNIFRGDVGDISSCVCGNKTTRTKTRTNQTSFVAET